MWTACSQMLRTTRIVQINKHAKIINKSDLPPHSTIESNIIKNGLSSPSRFRFARSHDKMWHEMRFSLSVWVYCRRVKHFAISDKPSANGCAPNYKWLYEHPPSTHTMHPWINGLAFFTDNVYSKASKIHETDSRQLSMIFAVLCSYFV